MPKDAAPDPGQPPPRPKRGFRWWVRYLLIVILTMLILFMALTTFNLRAGPLRAATRDADRVVVTFEHSWLSDPPTLDCRDPALVQSLVDTIAVDHLRSSWPPLLPNICACRGDPELRFFQGDRLLAHLSLHHGKSLRWLDGSWSGDTTLTQVSAASIAAWLHGQGLPASREEAKDRERQREAEVGDNIKEDAAGDKE